MSRKKKKKRQPDTAVMNDDLKMSDVILKLAEPLLKEYGNNPQRFEVDHRSHDCRLEQGPAA